MTYEISSSSDRGTSRPLVTGEGAKMCLESAERRKMVKRDEEEREGENDIYYHPLCREYHCGVG